MTTNDEVGYVRIVLHQSMSWCEVLVVDAYRRTSCLRPETPVVQWKMLIQKSVDETGRRHLSFSRVGQYLQPFCQAFGESTLL
jgi:energy-converting hydrogenase Eha subunit B